VRARQYSLGFILSGVQRGWQGDLIGLQPDIEAACKDKGLRVVQKFDRLVCQLLDAIPIADRPEKAVHLSLAAR
jgi:hypothetical protein